jgi:hypothetical protein
MPKAEKRTHSTKETQHMPSTNEFAEWLSGALIERLLCRVLPPKHSAKKRHSANIRFAECYIKTLCKLPFDTR